MIDLATFAAERGDRLTTHDAELRPLVARALAAYGSGDAWIKDLTEAASVLWLEVFSDAAPDAFPDRAMAKFGKELGAALRKTAVPDDPPSEGQVDRVTYWLSTFTANNAAFHSATAGGYREFQWATRDDEKVRPMHAAAAGQKVRVGGTFNVGGHKLHYPGEPVGPPEVWINCRCLVRGTGKVRQMSLTAAAPEGESFEERTGVVVVALPAADDPIVAASSEDIPHITMVWLGDVSQLPVEVDALKANLESWASQIDGPLVEAVSGRATLGADSAEVVLVDAKSLAEIRNGMVAEEPEVVGEGNPPLAAIATAYSQTEQFPTWIPHVTLGYPNTPPTSDYAGTEISFDRLALWVGDDRTEFPMGSNPAPAETEPKPKISEATPSFRAMLATYAHTEAGKAALAEYEMDEPLVAAAVVAEESSEIDELGDVADQQAEDDEPSIDDEIEIPFHGVAAPIGKPSGDRREFSEVTSRPTPYPLLFQYQTAEGHDTSVRVGTIHSVEERDGMFRYEGLFKPGISEPMVEQAIEGIVDGSARGVSIDADDVIYETPEGIDEEVVYNSAAEAFDATMNPAPTKMKVRMAGLTIVAIPAFVEQFIALGTWAEAEDSDHDEVDGEPAEEESLVAAGAPGLKDDGTPPTCKYGPEPATQYVLHSEGMAYVPTCDEHLEQAKTDAADGDPGNIDRVGKYGLETFAPGTKDGPGWVTNPEDTARIRRYWVRGKGAAKIKWGVPGDFNRCRSHLAKYVRNPNWLAGLCANMHKEALGIWPGQEGGRAALIASGGVVAEPFSLIAAGGPVFDADWFKDPQLTDRTPLVITDEGRVFGHIADWTTCHIGYQGQCKTAPHSASNYAYFRTGAVRTTEGDVPVGQITMDTGHAGERATARKSIAHYDNTGTAIMDVAAGEDQFGIWIAGALRPGLSPEQVHKARAASFSGDWREIGGFGNLEMVAALAVNVPGFPIPRASLAASGGRVTAMTAAGIIVREGEPEPGTLDIGKIIEAAADVVESRQKRRARAASVVAAADSAFRADRVARAARVFEEGK